MRFRSRNEKRSGGLPIAPMVDVVFLLLCFFVTSQIFSQWETEIDVKLPTAQTGAVPQRLPGEVIINVMKGGEIIVSGRTLDDESVAALMNRLVKLFPGQPVLIRGDRQTDYEHIIKVLDLCRKADIWNISFATAQAD